MIHEIINYVYKDRFFKVYIYQVNIELCIRDTILLPTPQQKLCVLRQVMSLFWALVLHFENGADNCVYLSGLL